MSSSDNQDEPPSSSKEDTVHVSTCSVPDQVTTKDPIMPQKAPPEMITTIHTKGGGDCKSPSHPPFTDKDNPKTDSTEVIIHNIENKDKQDLSTDKDDPKMHLTEVTDLIKNKDKDEQISENITKVGLTTVNSENPGPSKYITSKAVIVDNIEFTSDKSDTSSINIDREDIKVDNNLKTLTQRLLDTRSNASSPRTPGDVDEYSSEMQEEEMVLKWDDTDESDEINVNDDAKKHSDSLKDNNDESNLDKAGNIDKKYSTGTELIEKDILKEIDAQISKLNAEVPTQDKDRRNVKQHSLNSSKDGTILKVIDAQVSGLDAELPSSTDKYKDNVEGQSLNIKKDESILKVIDAQITEINSELSSSTVKEHSKKSENTTSTVLVDKNEKKIDLSEATDTKNVIVNNPINDGDKYPKKVNVGSIGYAASTFNTDGFDDNEDSTKMDVDTNLAVDSIIADLDQMIDEPTSTEDKPINTSKLTEEKISTATDNDKIAKDVNIIDTIKPIGLTQINPNDNQMDLDSSHKCEETDIKVSELKPQKVSNTADKMDLDSSVVLDDSLTNNEPISDIQITANSTAIDPGTYDMSFEDTITAKPDVPKDRELNFTASQQSLSSEHDSNSTMIGPTDHNLKKPDMMIEIPTQELIDCTDDSLYLSNNDSNTDIIDQKNIVAEDKVTKQQTDAEKAQEITEPPKSLTKIDTKALKLPDIDVESNKQKTVDKSNDLPVKDSEKSKEEAKSDIEDTAVKSCKQIEPQLSVDNIVTPSIKDQSAIEANKHKDISIEQISKADDLSSKEEGNLPISEQPPASEDQSSIKKISSKDEQKSKNEDQSSIKELPKDAATVSTEERANKTADQSSVMENEQSMRADTSDEVPEVTDSLGLLAESSRVMEDDEEQETSEHDDDDGDGEEDFDPDDESSNQMTAEHSEDSNAQQSETDLSKDKAPAVEDLHIETDDAQDFIDNTPEVGTPEEEKEEFNFAISNVISETLVEDKEGDESMEVVVEDIVCDDVEVTSDTIGDHQIDGTEQLEPAVETEDTTVTESTIESEKEKPEEPVQVTETPMDIETVKLSDTSDNDEPGDKVKDEGQLRGLLSPTPKNTDDTADKSKQSPSKAKKLEITKPKHVVNIVELEESSSEDDIQEVSKNDVATTPDIKSDGVTSVNISGQIEIMSSGGNTSDITTKEGEIVISGVPKPPPQKPARLNTSEVTIKTASTTESTLVIPEAKITEPKREPSMSMEVFSLDSDDEDSQPATEKPAEAAKPSNNKCINNLCTGDGSTTYYIANPSVVAYYEPGRKRRALVCQGCADAVNRRAQALVEGVKNFTPLLDMDMGRPCQELVEISDSDSDDEGGTIEVEKEILGKEGAKMLEEQLASVLNETWLKYNLDTRFRETQDELQAELERLQKDSTEVDIMLTECQQATDRLRAELYDTFERERQTVPAIVIFDTPENMFSCTEAAQLATMDEKRQSKRRLSSASETPPKRPAIPLGYTPLDNDPVKTQTPVAEPAKLEDVKPPVPMVPATVTDASKLDDDKDISVVNLSAESAPADLPAPGEITRPSLRVNMQVFAMKNAFGSWLRAKVVECTPKGSSPAAAHFTLCRVKFENKLAKNAYKLLPGRCLAYPEPAEVRMTIGTRVIALFKDHILTSRRESYYSGIVAEVPNPVNNYRYLVFFDDGYAQYVQHRDTRLVCEFSSLVWEEVHPFSREFVREYLLAYPERPMVRLHTGQSIKTEWNGKWWISRVIQVDASLVLVHFQEDNRTEWIYRGSTRLAPLYLELQAAERHRARPLPRNRVQSKLNMPYVEYTRSDEPPPPPPAAPPTTNSTTTKLTTYGQLQTHAQAQEDFRRQRAVAKKSTGAPPPTPPPPQPPPTSVADTVTSRVVYYTPKNAVKPHKMVTHTCSPRCRRSDVLALQDLRTYNPLAKPLLSGWERQLVRFKGHKQVMYRAPCGRRLRNMRELHRYLRTIQSDMGVDLFDFGPGTHCLAEFVLNKCIIAKKDLSNGKENVPVPCVNYYDNSLPEFCSYNTERTPTEGVPLNLDPDFLCGCDCTDDCEDKSKCACWQLTLEGARTIGLEGGNIGYSYKRLPEPLSSGIYECNSKCKCKSTCLNRVAQHPLQLKLQVFKTLNRGWGIRALNDVPKGSFLCVYAGNLLTDATANLDGLNEGDEYLAELDYIEVVEQMKEGYEEDIPDADKKLDKKETGKGSCSSEEMSSSEDEDNSKNEKEDGDFEPGHVYGITEFNKRLRRREKAKKERANAAAAERHRSGQDNCITISDDEEVREPSRFMAQAGMGANEFISKYRSVRSCFGEDEACYIMDAKVQGNIGRYLNHSCSPNVFVQNVFVDTHDPRFPWVAFFALWPIRAGTELTWNYNYDIGSVPSKVLYCYCGAPNCRGRLL